jgi:protein TonB
MLAAPSASGRAISVPTTMSRPRRFQSQGLAVATPTVPRAAGLPGAPSAAAALPASDDGVLLGQFTSEIHAMVQAAAAMPAVARRQHREGRAQVRFSYLDGAVDGVTVTQSTMFRPLDDAALAAVRQARYPAPPARLRGRRLSLVIWIDFRLQAPTEG